MLVGRHTTAHSAEIQSSGVHLSMCLTVERVRKPWRNAPEKFYYAVRGCSQPRTVEFWGESVRKNQPLVPRSNIAGS